MQPTGGGETSRGLARFRSAPATWLDALLESVEEDDDLLKPTPHQQSVAQVPPTARSSSAAVSYVDPVGLFDGGVASSGSGFLRQSSSPAEFLAQISSGSDSYFSHFELPGNNYDYLPSSIEASSSSSKRQREQDLERPSAKLSSQLKEEDQSVHLPRGISGLLDPEMEKLLEDSVPCRVRAKRGCATHPRSIAERVRRTRISDRIRKLQELVPNMDKQTNTSDMLEEAVEYVKFLQKQIQELTEQQKNCTCVSRD